MARNLKENFMRDLSRHSPSLPLGISLLSCIRGPRISRRSLSFHEAYAAHVGNQRPLHGVNVGQFCRTSEWVITCLLYAGLLALARVVYRWWLKMSLNVSYFSLLSCRFKYANEIQTRKCVNGSWPMPRVSWVIKWLLCLPLN